MTVQEILANEQLRAHEFPVAADTAYLAHAGVCPLPRRVNDAINAYLQKGARDDQEMAYGAGRFTRVRQLAGQLLGASPETIALVGPTSLGLSFVASGFPFRKGDNMLVYFDDYPSNVYPWMALAERGVQVRFLNVRELGRIRPMDVEGQVDERTRLVALASCHFISGWRIDIPAIGKFLHSRDIAFCVDGIQTLGAFPTPVEHVDFLAADAHKWLLGPCAAGILYVAKAWHDKLKPQVHGWHNVRCPDYVAQEQLVFASNARRYEAGTANLIGLVGLEAAMDMLLQVGVDNIARELARKRVMLVKALREKGYSVFHADASPEQTGGITSFCRELTDLAALHAKLVQNKIVTSLRSDRPGKKYIRLSPHFYNTDEELQRCLSHL